MRENKKGVPTVAAVENADKQIISTESFNTAIDNIPFSEPHLKHIMELLPHDKAAAIHQDKLASMVGVSSRTLKKIIKAARKSGYPILSDICGYWYSDDEEEVKAFLLSMQKQAISRLDSISYMNSMLKGFKGQLKLSDIEVKE